MTPCLHGLTTSRLRRFKIPDFHSFATSELRRFEIPYLHSFVTSELRRLKIPDLHSFTTSELRRVKIPDLHSFATSELRRFKILDLHSFATSELRRFTISDLHRVNHPKNSFHEFRQTRRFEGNSFFLNCPTLAPRGSGLTATIRFHENHWISVKKRHPLNVGVDTRPPETSQRSNRGGFLKLPPRPYKLRALVVKNFHRVLVFFRTLACIFTEKRLTTKCSQLQDFVEFSKVLLCLLFCYHL
jgi:hypothetical protein